MDSKLKMKKLTSEVDYLADMAKIIKAYEEIAAFRMRNVRERVLKNRDYTGELNTIFQIVKVSYQKLLEQYKLSDGQRKNGKTVRLFLSANTGLYGDMVQRIFNLFLAELKASPSETIIAGRLGKSLFDSCGLRQKYLFFEIPDREMLLEEIKRLVDVLLPYEKVIVYHGVFKNIVMQEAAASNLSGETLLPKEEKPATRQLIFEPSLTEVLSFFETEIFSGLLMQVIFESQLAKFSSRMSSLEQASENIRKETALKKLESFLLGKRLNDKKQQEMLAGRSLWGI